MVTYVPGSHVFQAVQLAALLSSLNVPLAHAAHFLSEVADGVLVTYVPLGHVVHRTHAVAPSPS